jgi:hypothetical protein
MDNDRGITHQALEKAFEVIKAKHKGIQACHSSQSDPLLLELADMILLFSAQLTLAAGTPAKRQGAMKGSFVGVKSKYPIH